MITAAEIAELKRQGETMMASGNFTPSPLESFAEIIGFAIYQMRALGEDDDTISAGLELVLRAAELEREHIRQARDVLSLLRYPDAIIKRLTMVARKTKPTPPRRWANRKIGAASASPTPIRSTSEAELALKMLRPRRRGGR